MTSHLIEGVAAHASVALAQTLLEASAVKMDFLTLAQERFRNCKEAGGGGGNPHSCKVMKEKITGEFGV